MKNLAHTCELKQVVTRIVAAILLIAAAESIEIAKARDYSDAETLILRQAAAGKVAQLDNLPPEKRTIRAEFLVPLLMGKLVGVPVSHEGVMITHATIRGRLGLAGAQLPYAVWLNQCEFLDDVDLSHSHLYADLSMVGSTFRGDVDLDGLQADGNVVLNMTKFDGVFDLSDAQINGNLEASGTNFAGRNGISAQFNNIKVTKRADLDHMTIAVPLILDGAESQILTVGAVASDYSPPELRGQNGPYDAKRINLSHSIIHRELRIAGMQIESLQASGIKVEGLAALENVHIKGDADLSHSQLFDLALADDVTWPDKEENLVLTGIFFQYISPETHTGAAPQDSTKEDAKWEKLSEWVDHASYTTAPYQQLEDTLRKEGRVDQANDIFKRGQQRAWSHGSLGLKGKLKNFFLHWLIGYGREPQQAFFWAIPVVLFGWFLFRRREDVQPREAKDQERPYDPLWYSLDLFLPLSTLQAADVWIPRQDSRFRRYYARVHSILGWILVPIGLAAVTGLISGK